MNIVPRAVDLAKLRAAIVRASGGHPGGSLPRNAWYGGAARVGPKFLAQV